MLLQLQQQLLIFCVFHPPSRPSRSLFCIAHAMFEPSTDRAMLGDSEPVPSAAPGADDPMCSCTKTAAACLATECFRREFGVTVFELAGNTLARLGEPGAATTAMLELMRFARPGPGASADIGLVPNPFATSNHELEAGARRPLRFGDRTRPRGTRLMEYLGLEASNTLLTPYEYMARSALLKIPQRVMGSVRPAPAFLTDVNNVGLALVAHLGAASAPARPDRRNEALMVAEMQAMVEGDRAIKRHVNGLSLRVLPRPSEAAPYTAVSAMDLALCRALAPLAHHAAMVCGSPGRAGDFETIMWPFAVHYATDVATRGATAPVCELVRAVLAAAGLVACKSMLDNLAETDVCLAEDECYNQARLWFENIGTIMRQALVVPQKRARDADADQLLQQQASKRRCLVGSS